MALYFGLLTKLVIFFCIEKVQRSFTKYLPGLIKYTYHDRLAATNLETRELTQLGACQVMSYKIVFD